MSEHVTYGDYSHVPIRKVICQRCKAPVKDFNLQRLLSEDECLCRVCKPPVIPQEQPHGTV
jgi:hypothetical protein